MTKYKLAPKSWLIPLTTSLCQLLKTLIKKNIHTNAKYKNYLEYF